MSNYRADPDRYSQAQYARVGRSGLVLPRLSLGLWQNFGDDRRFDVQRAIVRRAFDAGVTHFDLANNYGVPYGSAERNFGRHLAGDLLPYRDELIISTKAGYDMWPGPYGDGGSRKYLLSSLDASLRRLGLEYVDIFYHHRHDPATPIEESMGALATAVSQGKALYVGISNYGPSEAIEAAEILRGHGIPLLCVQPPYSMFDREAEAGLLDTIRGLGAGAVVYSPLAQGMLTDRYLAGSIPADSRAAIGQEFDASSVGPVYRQRAEALAGIARSRGQTLAQLALSWVLRHDVVATALVGASSVSQLEQNLEALAAPPLTAEEIARIEPWAVHGTALDE